MTFHYSKRIFVIALIVAAIILVISLCFWIIFPLVFPVLVQQNLVLSVNDDGIPSTATFFWSKPPVEAIMNFYFFNITNPDEVIYEGAKPILLELGPFAIRYSEQKQEYRFLEDGQKVYYKNYKRYTFAKELSCDYCDENTSLTIPNVVAVGALTSMMNPKYGCGSACRTLINIGMLLFGENPFRTVKFIDVIFNGYYDPFLSFAHSEFYVTLCDVFNNGEPLIPFPIPSMQKMAYFYGYNDTNDEDYVIETGKSSVNEIGDIAEWAGARSLPFSWWKTLNARMINGSDSASLTHPQLTKNDVLPFFLSLMCRSFYAVYDGETEVEGIPSYRFITPYEAFDTTSNENSGFRYENAEQVDYFKEWSPCPNRYPSLFRISTNYCSKITWTNCSKVTFVDCSRRENFCNVCCEGKFVDGTYLLPPGMFPLTCFPGKNELLPFSAIFSPPHWVFSPSEVQQSVRGLSPDRSRHLPFVFTREPTSGMLTSGHVRLMASLPLFNNNKATMAMNVNNMLIPAFWIDTEAKLNEAIYATIRRMFIKLPWVIRIVQIVTLVVAILIALAAIAWRIAFAFYKRRHQ
ncbi:unnamed protein product [Anisakis simplex]|uniref:Scavenger receptor class B member 1 n=1 Tax=Anisakis simplex TaxID=6269 RepID=A0A0M3JYJ5_ANISI|nr:unnamed protein product [Anisakis simplex]